MGWSSEILGPLGAAFVECARGHPGDRVLDIGAGYGAASLAALAAGAQVLANDLDEELLEELRLRAGQSLPPEMVARLTLAPARFPRSLRLAQSSLEAVHAANVLHFLTGPQIDRGLHAMARWLRPGGRVFLQAASPYRKPFTAFIPEFERRLAGGERWPGWMEQVRDWSAHRLLGQIPRSLHLLDEQTLVRACREAGLEVERSWLDRSPDLSPTLFLDGRETLAVIAVRRPGGS